MVRMLQPWYKHGIDAFTLRLQDCVPPTHINYCTHPNNTVCVMHVTEHIRLNSLQAGLETTQSSHSNCVSNLRAVGPRKFCCEFLTIALLLEQCPHVAFFPVKVESCFMVQAFVPVSYRCLNCSAAAKRSLGMKYASYVPAPS